MIKRRGSLFESTAPALGHGVNCVGVMGAGIAKTFKEKFPNNYINYVGECGRGNLRTGGILVNKEAGIHIINMATQEFAGPDARYHAVFAAGLSTARYAVHNDIDTVAIPMIGCGIGGLEWPKVEKILRVIEEIVDGDFQWEVWRL